MKTVSCESQIKGAELPDRKQRDEFARKVAHAKAQSRKGAKKNCKSQISNFRFQIKSEPQQVIVDSQTLFLSVFAFLRFCAKSVARWLILLLAPTFRVQNPRSPFPGFDIRFSVFRFPSPHAA